MLTAREKLFAVVAVALAGLMASVELVGIGAIFWFMQAVVDPAVMQQPLVAWLDGWLGIGDRRSLLLMLGGAVIAFMTFRNGLGVLNVYVQLKFAAHLSANMATRLLAAYLSKPYVWYLTQNASVLTRNIAEEVPKLVSGCIVPTLNLVADGTVVVAIVLMLIAYDPMMTLLIAVTGGFFGGVYVLIRGTLTRLGGRRIRHSERRFRIANEAMNAIKEVKIAGRERNFLKDFRHEVRQLIGADVMSAFVKLSPRYILELVGFCTLIGVTLFAIARGREGQDLIGLLTLYGMAGLRLMPAINKLLEATSSIRFNSAILPVIGEHLERPVPPPAPAAEPLPFNREIALEAVHFRYEGQPCDVLCGIDLTIAHNTTVGFVGSTGAGKTTLVDLLMGLLTPSGGRIAVDDRTLEPADAAAWQANVGYVPQQIHLLDRSISENIALGVPPQRIDMTRVREAARLARIDAFVETLPEGYATVVGDRGTRLSGGQRQRIGIARALYQRPALLVLDEATSALDSVTEAEIGEAIASLGHRITIVIIAHRLTTVRGCDRIYRLEAGRVAAAGRYEELLADDAGFRRLALESAA